MFVEGLGIRQAVWTRPLGEQNAPSAGGQSVRTVESIHNAADANRDNIVTPLERVVYDLAHLGLMRATYVDMLV